MPTQNYANHRRLVPMFHGVLFLLIVLTLIGSLVNLYESLGDHQRLYSASLIVAVTIALLILYFFCRIFPLKAQDRAIRAEENLRHFALTGKLLDPKLTVHQVIALRFAPDNEFVELAQRAAGENMPPDDIKRAIKQWKADTYRV
jgi:L-cystine uptake protein TcyP (sodium:dicarboxylate symporter family)